MQTMIDLTDRFPMRFEVDRMRKELENLEKSTWVDHYDRKISNGWTTLLLSTRDGTMDRPDSMRPGRWGRFKRTPVLEQLPYFGEVLDAFRCPVGRVRVSKLMPHSSIGEHRDIGREAAGIAYGQVRLHIPITTNDRVTFHVGREVFQLRAGRLYYLDFTKLHSVRNDGDEPRIHLILELRVNDFLWRVFPEPDFSERVQRFVLRHTMPLVWPFMQAKFAVKQLLTPVPAQAPARSGG
jgi:hypothetical protein